MPIFAHYARYYNLLYKDKDYAGEVVYIDQLIKKYNPKAQSVLDLGCGTGRHDFLLVDKGYAVTGVDMSDAMLSEARANLKQIRSSKSPNSYPLIFHQADIRTVRLNRAFDVVISLFHVMSYQTGNADLKQAFETAKAHLNPGGFFIFDCWYGPGVMATPPALRVKELEDEAISVTRIAKPVIHPNENVVDVNYHIFIRDKITQQVDELRECHRMRYLFKPEVDLLLAQTGFKLKDFFKYMEYVKPAQSTWQVCFVSQKKPHLPQDATLKIYPKVP